jgi:hypothetical protein
VETLDHSKAEASPNNSPAMDRIAPPAIICCAAVIIGDSGLSAYLVYSEPVAQAMLASIKAATPVKSTLVLCQADRDPTSNITPAKPTTMPSAVCNVGRTPPGRSQSNSANHNGVPAMMSAVNPDGTFCSAQFTPPLPMPMSNAAAMVARRQLVFEGAGVPVARSQVKRISPDTRNRAPPMRNGGRVSTAKRMPRYVDPHIK